jgi:hypothetical protein
VHHKNGRHGSQMQTIENVNIHTYCTKVACSLKRTSPNYEQLW